MPVKTESRFNGTFERLYTHDNHEETADHPDPAFYNAWNRELAYHEEN